MRWRCHDIPCFPYQSDWFSLCLSGKKVIAQSCVMSTEVSSKALKHAVLAVSCLTHLRWWAFQEWIAWSAWLCVYKALLVLQVQTLTQSRTFSLKKEHYWDLHIVNTEWHDYESIGILVRCPFYRWGRIRCNVLQQRRTRYMNLQKRQSSKFSYPLKFLNFHLLYAQYFCQVWLKQLENMNLWQNKVHI